MDIRHFTTKTCTVNNVIRWTRVYHVILVVFNTETKNNNEQIAEKTGKIDTAVDTEKYGLRWRYHLKMIANTRFPKRHFIMGPNVDAELQDQRKDGPTGIESQNGPICLINGKEAS